MYTVHTDRQTYGCKHEVVQTDGQKQHEKEVLFTVTSHSAVHVNDVHLTDYVESRVYTSPPLCVCHVHTCLQILILLLSQANNVKFR